MVDIYLWFKTLHILAVISWMAGLLYLPRLLVYHAAAAKGSTHSEVFKVMERRLYRVIMWPAMAAAFVSGAVLVWVLWETGIQRSGWAWVKLSAVVGLMVFHLWLGKHLQRFQRDENVHTSRYFRVANELPTLLLVVIVIMVVVKPF